MIEEFIMDYLNNCTELSASAYTEEPATLPTAYYLIEKTGGSLTNHIKRSTITIQSYGGSLYDSANMNEELKEVMLYNLIGEDEIVSVSLNSDYNYTNTQSKRYRYQAVFDIVHY